jgi:hypothetical protein
MTDVASLGKEYTVADESRKFIKNIQIIPYEEILNATVGPYNETEFKSFKDYLKKSTSALTGFEKIDPLKVLWYTTPEDTFPLMDIVEYAIEYGYDRVILEHLPKE